MRSRSIRRDVCWERFDFRLFVFREELFLEFAEQIQHVLQFLLLREDCRSEVISARLLSKSSAGNDANASLFEQLESVESVGRLICLFRGIDSLLWKQNPRKKRKEIINIIHALIRSGRLIKKEDRIRREKESVYFNFNSSINRQSATTILREKTAHKRMPPAYHTFFLVQEFCANLPHQ
jgi:hypothetical protein